MAYTEIKERNNRKYFYRVISIRKDRKIKKDRTYLGVNLNINLLNKKIVEADKINLENKRKKNIKKIKISIIPILKKNKIRKAGIFGSYSKGLQRKNSDIDLIIEPPKDMGLGFVKIKYELENKLGKKVDLITYNSIHSLLKKKILSEEERIL